MIAFSNISTLEYSINAQNLLPHLSFLTIAQEKKYLIDLLHYEWNNDVT